jgi:flagellar basal-body rod protein FlgB
LVLCRLPLYHQGMNSTSTDVFALAEKRLAWIGQRQSILAQNIANANTPGYAARDIRPFSEVLADQTHQAENNSAVPVSSGAASSSDRAVSGRSLDGNAVTLDEQLEKVAETDTAHQLATNLYKKYVSLFKTAIGRN